MHQEQIWFLQPFKDVAESFEFNSGDEDVIELAKQALTIIGLATLGHELTNNIVEVTA
jgi:hypothetical protein